MISREEMHQEFILRENIQKSVKSKLTESNKKKRLSLKEEMILRSFINSVLSEAVQSASSDPHSSTGINFLTTLFRNTSFLSNLEEKFKSMTTDPSQRDSFKSHIMKAIDMTITRMDELSSASDLSSEDDGLNEIDIEIDDEDALPGYVSMDKETKEDKEEKEKEEFKIDGEDDTGRNAAFETYNNIEKFLVDSYSSLGNPADKETFRKYLSLNLDHYFDEWESELSNDLGDDQGDGQEIEDPVGDLDFDLESPEEEI